MIEDLKEWIKVNLGLLDFDDEMGSMNFIGELTSRIFEISLMMTPSRLQIQAPNIHSSDASRCMNEAIRYGHEIWIECLSYINSISNTHKDELSKIGFIMMMQLNLQQYDESNASEKRLKELIQTAIKTTLEQDLDIDDEAEYHLTTEQIDELLQDSDKNLLHMFFTTLQTLGTFYKDESNYESEEDRKLHEKLMALYSLIMKGGKP